MYDETAERSDQAHQYNMLMNFIKKRNAVTKIEETAKFLAKEPTS